MATPITSFCWTETPFYCGMKAPPLALWRLPPQGNSKVRAQKLEGNSAGNGKPSSAEFFDFCILTLVLSRAG
jgi:hypothetical protein